MELEGILSEFPYLQSARAIHLKALYNQESFRYNLELKKTASYTTDRSVLFDFITSEQFRSIQKGYFEGQQKTVSEIEVVLPQDEPANTIAAAPVDKAEASVLLSIKSATPPAEISNEVPKAKAILAAPNVAGEENTAQGKPLPFDSQEKHSFAEWLQLSRLSPVDRGIQAKPEITEPPHDEGLAKKLELIDRFIETNPKIMPVRGAVTPPANIEKSVQENSSLMTETLARVYLEQKKYQKAIQAYEILILKYPEKSVFFADRISEIKNLQQNN